MKHLSDAVNEQLNFKSKTLKGFVQYMKEAMIKDIDNSKNSNQETDENKVISDDVMKQ